MEFKVKRKSGMGQSRVKGHGERVRLSLAQAGEDQMECFGKKHIVNNDTEAGVNVVASRVESSW